MLWSKSLEITILLVGALCKKGSGYTNVAVSAHCAFFSLHKQQICTIALGLVVVVFLYSIQIAQIGELESHLEWKKLLRTKNEVEDYEQIDPTS